MEKNREELIQGLERLGITAGEGFKVDFFLRAVAEME